MKKWGYNIIIKILLLLINKLCYNYNGDIMKRVKKRNTVITNNWIIPKRFLLFYLFIMLILLLQFAHISLFKVVNGNNLREIAANRTTVSKDLIADRGTIYDNSGNILATNVTSYTLIAYLSEKRTDNPDKPRHVVDKEKTAKLLSEKLDAPFDYILERLNEDRYQVEFGTYGSKLTELEKIAIENLELPGIDFVESTKRFYPNGQFASYIIGYAKEYTRINLKLKEELDLKDLYDNYYKKYDNVVLTIGDERIISAKDSKIKAIKVGSTSFKLTIGKSDKILINGIINVTKNDIINSTDIVTQGELGIEGKFNEVLKGTNGSLTYQRDPSGYKIPDTPEQKIEAVDGKDIYLTIDSSIQRFLETAVKKQIEDYKSEWIIMAVMDAKTGEILGSATSPSFDPNNLSSDMSYQNPLVSYSYEPGSVMKTYTYLCAANKGKYDGNKKFKSGSIDINGTVVKDSNDGEGWGTISYDYGFIKSSNVGAINVAKSYLSPSELKNCLKSYGFGSKTDIELSGELAGDVNYRENIDIDYLSVSFGQGLLTTPIQQLQALSIIANEGQMVKPHVISKIVDNKTGEEEVTKVEVTERVASKEAANKVKQLMYENVQNDNGTGRYYRIDGYDIIGKTGTAQIFENGKYTKNSYLISFAGMFPYDDPQIIIYTAIKKPKTFYHEAISPYVQEVIGNIAKYKNMYAEVDEKNSSIKKYKTASFINTDTVITKNKLEKINMNVIVIGDGDKIVSQFPKEGSSVVTGDKFFLITNGTKTTMPDMKGWALTDLTRFAKYANVKYKYSGHGYITKQNIKTGSIIGDQTIEVELSNKN